MTGASARRTAHSTEDVPVCQPQQPRPTGLGPAITTRARSATMPVSAKQGTVKGWARGSVCADSVASPVGADPVHRRVVHPAQASAGALGQFR